MESQNIGIFDSGLGGLTVMKELMQKLPHESMIYLGDTARVPYGNKSAKTILRYSLENADFLVQKNIKLLVVACNTACSCAIETLQQTLSIPVVGVITPGFETLMQTTQNLHVAILGTQATISSGIFSRLILENYPHATVYPIAAPLFVPLVEEGFSLDHPITKLTIQEYLKGLKGTPVDAVLLACTHYPLLAPALQQELGPNVRLVDSGASCARKVETILCERGIQASSKEIPTYQFFVTDDSKKFRMLGEKFLGKAMSFVEEKPC